MTTRERCESAIRYRKNGANCAQSLLAAFADVMGITEAQAMAMGAGLGGCVRSGGKQGQGRGDHQGVPAAVYGAIPASQLPGAVG